LPDGMAGTRRLSASPLSKMQQPGCTMIENSNDPFDPEEGVALVGSSWSDSYAMES
jgi:hypothetical protein